MNGFLHAFSRKNVIIVSLAANVFVVVPPYLDPQVHNSVISDSHKTFLYQVDNTLVLVFFNGFKTSIDLLERHTRLEVFQKTNNVNTSSCYFRFTINLQKNKIKWNLLLYSRRVWHEFRSILQLHVHISSSFTQINWFTFRLWINYS